MASLLEPAGLISPLSRVLRSNNLKETSHDGEVVSNQRARRTDMVSIDFMTSLSTQAKDFSSTVLFISMKQTSAADAMASHLLMPQLIWKGRLLAGPIFSPHRRQARRNAQARGVGTCVQCSNVEVMQGMLVGFTLAGLWSHLLAT